MSLFENTRKEKVSELINNAHKDIWQFKRIDERFRRTNPAETDTFIGSTKNQPILTLFAWKSFRKTYNNTQKFSTDFLRLSELSVENTNNYWKLQTNFFSSVLSRNLSVTATRMSEDKNAIDFLVRTRGFCFANRNSYASPAKTEPSFNRDFIYDFFHSELLPKELRFEITDKTKLKQITDFLSKTKESFDLNKIEYSSLVGNIYGSAFSKNLKLAKEISENNLIKKVRDNPEIDNFIFDLTFGSAMNFRLKNFVIESEEDDDFFNYLEYTQKILEDAYLCSFYNTAYAICDKIDFNSKYDVLGNVDIDVFKERFFEAESIFQKEQYDNDRLNNTRNLSYSFNNDEIKDLFSNRILKSNDPVQELINIYQPDFKTEFGNVLDLRIFQKYSEVIFKDLEERATFAGIYYCAFPILFQAPSPFTFHGDSGQELIKKYLEYGGDTSNIHYLQDIIKK